MILSIDEEACVSNDLLDDQRQTIKALADLARFLPTPHDRMVRGILLQGRSLASVSRDLGLNWVVAKRLYRRLIRRMGSRAFRRVVRHFHRLDPAEQALARRAVLAGEPLRQLATGLGVSIHMVRKQLAGLLAKLARLEMEHHDGAREK